MTMICDETKPVADAIHIVIADNHPLVRGALRTALSTAMFDAHVREAGDLASLGREVARGKPVDLILLDLAMPGVCGFSGLLYLRSQHPEIPIIIVSATEDRDVMRRCIEVGASGFVSRSTEADMMREAIRVVLDGEIWTPADLDMHVPPDAAVAATMRRLSSLTPQQLRVLMMLTQGLLNKQIAFELNVSEATVKAHVSAILQKLDVESRTQAVTFVSTIDQGQFSKGAKRG